MPHGPGNGVVVSLKVVPVLFSAAQDPDELFAHSWFFCQNYCLRRKAPFSGYLTNDLLPHVKF